MDIIFNCLDSGLGNNGGSRTIVRSANTLKKLGHNVCILNPEPKRLKMDEYRESSYTWDEIDVPVIHNINQIEKADVIIATAFSTVKTTLEAPKKLGKKFHWIRGWESWSMSEKDIVKKVLNQPTIKIVNSTNLQDKLKEYNIESTIIRPGYDFDELYPINTRHTNSILTIGGLYSKGDKRSTKRCNWIMRAINEIKKIRKVCLIMYGAEGHPQVNDPIDLFVSDPSPYIKNSIYNECNIWVAPTCNDALHLPPAEAMQTECCVVGTNNPMNGMKDYLIHKKTGYLSNDNYESFRDCILYIMERNELRVKFGEEGKKKIESLGTRKFNMNKLLNFLEDNL